MHKFLKICTSLSAQAQFLQPTVHITWVQFQPQNIRKGNIFHIPKNQHKGFQNIRKKSQTAKSTEEGDLGEMIKISIEGLGELAAGFEGEIVHEVVLPSELDKCTNVAIKLQVIID